MIYFLRSHVLLPEGNTFLVLLSANSGFILKFCNKVFISVKICPNLNGSKFSCNDTKLTLYWHLSTCVMTVIYGSFVLL